MFESFDDLQNDSSSEIELSIDDIENSDTKIAIYNISRDVFHKFLENPSREFFNIEDCNIYEYVEGKPFQAINGSNIFNLDTDFVKFVNDKSVMKDFLLQHNIGGNIEEITTFWPSKAPIIIWVKIDGKDIFLQDESSLEEPLDYKFSVISYNDFYQRFRPRKAILNVNGNIIETVNDPIIYYDYCEIPFLTTLDALGATYKWKNDTEVKINYNKNYRLNIKNHNIYTGLFSDSLLPPITGTHFLYKVDNDVMISNRLFEHFLEGMETKVLVDIDKENNVVFITKEIGDG